MRTDRKQRHCRLIHLIENTIADEPQDFEGFTWAARPLEDWAKMLGTSLATVKRLIALAPIVRKSVQIDGLRAVLLRVGEPGPMTPREIANAMGRRYRKKIWAVSSNSCVRALE